MINSDDLLPAGVETYWAGNVWDRTIFENSSLGKQFKNQMVLLRKSLENHKPKKILILCCGVGVEAAIAEKMDFVEEIVAIDINKKSCELTKQRVTSSKVTVINDNVYNIDYAEQFDAVVCMDALHHLGKQKFLFKQIQKALKPKGYFIGDYFGKELFMPWMIKKHGILKCHYVNSKHHVANFLYKNGLLPRKLVKDGWIRAFLFTQQEVKQHLENQNFEVVEINSDEWHFFVAKKVYPTPTEC